MNDRQLDNANIALKYVLFSQIEHTKPRSDVRLGRHCMASETFPGGMSHPETL